MFSTVWTTFCGTCTLVPVNWWKSVTLYLCYSFVPKRIVNFSTFYIIDPILLDSNPSRYLGQFAITRERFYYTGFENKISCMRQICEWMMQNVYDLAGWLVHRAVGSLALGPPSLSPCPLTVCPLKTEFFLNIYLLAVLSLRNSLDIEEELLDGSMYVRCVSGLLSIRGLFLIVK
jgi:hypothetical protein